jgi:hypothetical protein
MREGAKLKAIFESDRKINVPKKKLPGEISKEVYVLRYEGEEYEGWPPKYGSIALFDISLTSRLLMFDLEFCVNLQFTNSKKKINVTFNRADLYQVYELLCSNFDAKFKIEIVSLDSALLEAWTRWPWNIDFLLFEFKHRPEKTLSFVKRHLPELITVMGLRKIPREFDERPVLVSFDAVPDELDW